MGSEPDWVTELMEERRKREDRAAKRAMRRRQSNEQLWIELAGEKLPEMLTSQQETEKYLQHDSWKLRLAAISIFRTLWGASPEMAKTCGKMAFGSSNAILPQVFAISGLAPQSVLKMEIAARRSFHESCWRYFSVSCWLVNISGKWSPANAIHNCSFDCRRRIALLAARSSLFLRSSMSSVTQSGSLPMILSFYCYSPSFRRSS